MKRIIKAHQEMMVIKQKVVQKTSSGIILSEANKVMGSMECFEGEVIALGDKCKKFKIGDWVIFGRNIFARMKIEGVEFLLMYERDVDCTLRDCDDDYELLDSECYAEEGEYDD